MPLADPCPGCGKVCYTYAEARKKAKRARRRKDPEYKDLPPVAYRCRAGTSFWHFGHHDNRRKK